MRFYSVNIFWVRRRSAVCSFIAWVFLVTFLTTALGSASEGELLLSETKSDEGISALFEFVRNPDLVTRLIDLAKKGVPPQRVQAEAKTLSDYLRAASSELDLGADAEFVELLAKSYVFARDLWNQKLGEAADFADHFSSVAKIQPEAFHRALEPLSPAEKTYFFFNYPKIVALQQKAHSISVRSADPAPLLDQLKEVVSWIDNGASARVRTIAQAHLVLRALRKQLPKTKASDDARTDGDAVFAKLALEDEMVALFTLEADQRGQSREVACSVKPSRDRDAAHLALIDRLGSLGSSPLIAWAQKRFDKEYKDIVVDILSIAPAVAARCFSAADLESSEKFQGAVVRLLVPETVPAVPQAAAAASDAEDPADSERDPAATPAPAPASATTLVPAPVTRARNLNWLNQLEGTDPFFAQLRAAISAAWFAEAISRLDSFSQWEGATKVYVDAETGLAEWQVYSALDKQWVVLQTDVGDSNGWANIADVEWDSKGILHFYFATSNPGTLDSTRAAIQNIVEDATLGWQWLTPLKFSVVLHNPSTSKRDLNRKKSKKDFAVALREKLSKTTKFPFKSVGYKTRKISSVPDKVAQAEKNVYRAAEELRFALIERWKGHPPKEEVQLAEKLAQGMRRAGYWLKDLKTRDLAEMFVPVKVPAGAVLFEATSNPIGQAYLVPGLGFTARKEGSEINEYAVPAFTIVGNQEDLFASRRQATVANTSGTDMIVYAIPKIALRTWHKKYVPAPADTKEYLQALVDARAVPSPVPSGKP